MGSPVLAGETIYALPFYLRRDFAPVMVEEMGLTNEELGWVSAAFGVLALICYFPGGWIADRFPARGLLTFSLASTGVGGFFLATLPGYLELVGLFALWGVSTILTFWAALIKATRSWGGQEEQGRAFGILDGGRGLVGWLLGQLAVVVFAQFALPRAGLRGVILMYAIACVMAALVVYRLVPLESDETTADERDAKPPADLSLLAEVARRPIVWLQAVIILTAYAGYWGTFDIAGFATDAYGMDAEASAGLSANLRILRPISAIAAGFVADRIGASRTILGAFVVMVLAFASLGGAAPSPSDGALMPRLVIETAAICASAFALRGIFYAVMAEGQLPMHLTGTTVGVVSIIGYSPDIFAPPLMGGLIDAYGVRGHQTFFLILAGAAALGAVAAAIADRRVRRLEPGKER